MLSVRISRMLARRGAGEFVSAGSETDGSASKTPASHSARFRKEKVSDNARFMMDRQCAGVKSSEQMEFGLHNGWTGAGIESRASPTKSFSNSLPPGNLLDSTAV